MTWSQRAYLSVMYYRDRYGWTEENGRALAYAALRLQRSGQELPAFPAAVRRLGLLSAVRKRRAGL